MFPFAFGVPLASRHNSPAATAKSPPNANVNSPNVRPTTANGVALQRETYAQKKANWKSSLRKAHPFMFRQPSNGNQVSNLQSNVATTNVADEHRRAARSSHRTLHIIRRVLTASLIALSVAIVIVGVIYADKLTPGSNNTAGTSLTTLSNEPTVGVPIQADDGELRMRITKRIDTAPFPESDPFDHATSDKTSLSQLLAATQANLPPASVIAALFFYVAALPIMTMIHACAEIAIFAVLRQLPHRHSKTSPTPSFADDDSFCDSDTEEINAEKFKHDLAYPALPVSPEFKPTPVNQSSISPRNKKLASLAPIFSIISSILLVEGWTVINGIQIHCEFLPSGKGSKVCPSPLSKDGLDDIKGLHNMSIVRLALSWAVVLIYLVQIAITVKQYKLFSLRRFRRSSSSDAEASPSASPQPNTSPRSLNSILTRNRSRSNSSRRKTVRFDLEEASRRQSEKGDDVQYIPAPSDGYDNGYGLTYNYSSNYAYAANGNNTGSNDVRTPWQWQGQFEEFVNKNQTSNGVNTNPVVAATLGTGLKIAADNKTGGSFDFGLASMRRLAREENAALAHKTGFLPSQLHNFRDSHGLNSHPTIGVAIDHQTRNLTSGAIPTGATAAIVPIGLSNTAVPFKPKFAQHSSKLQRNDTVISAMTNGRKSVDLNAIDESGKRDISPLSN